MTDATELDDLRAQVERLHFDLDREARARQAAEKERDEAARHRDVLLNGFFASCPDNHEHGVWCGSAWVAVTARAEAAESALAAVQALADEWETFGKFDVVYETAGELARVLRAALATPTTTEESNQAGHHLLAAECRRDNCAEVHYARQLPDPTTPEETQP